MYPNKKITKTEIRERRIVGTIFEAVFEQTWWIRNLKIELSIFLISFLYRTIRIVEVDIPFNWLKSQWTKFSDSHINDILQTHKIGSLLDSVLSIISNEKCKNV